MRVAIVSGSRPDEPMGQQLAESRLLEALRRLRGSSIDLRVVGGRAARRYARRATGRWIPAAPGRSSALAWSAADAVHLLGLDVPPPRRRPYVAMVHDLAQLHFPDEGTPPHWLDEVVERARLLLVPSRFTADDLQTTLGVPAERLRVIGGGPALDARKAAPLTAGELVQLGIEPPFALRLGGYTKRKNVPLLLAAWSRVPVGTLVLCGPPQPARAEALAAAASLDRIVLLDYVPESLLARLLRTANVVVSTSQYEGFGLPPLEAMAAGTAVVAVRAPFAEEVCGDAAYLVEREPDAVALALTEVLEDAQLSVRLQRAGLERAAELTWTRAAESVLDAYAAAFR